MWFCLLRVQSVHSSIFNLHMIYVQTHMWRQAELLATQVWQPEFHSWDPHEKLGLVLHICKLSVLIAKWEVENCSRLQGQLVWSSQRSRNERDCLNKKESQIQLPPKNDLHCTHKHTTHTLKPHTCTLFKETNRYTTKTNIAQTKVELHPEQNVKLSYRFDATDPAHKHRSTGKSRVPGPASSLVALDINYIYMSMSNYSSFWTLTFVCTYKH